MDSRELNKRNVTGSKEQTLVFLLVSILKAGSSRNNYENVLAAAWEKAITL
jgi:hypothetical protein